MLKFKVEIVLKCELICTLDMTMDCVLFSPDILQVFTSLNALTL